MVLIPICCPHCGSDQVVKRGTTAARKQRYRCQNESCAHQTFIRAYSYRAYLPQVRQQMINMAVNGSGIRDTGRVLRVGKDTVLRALKKEPELDSVNQTLLSHLNSDDVTVAINPVGEAEADEMWSFVNNKKEPRWRWHAIDHQSGAVLAYCSVGAKTRYSFSSKPCCSRLESPAITPITWAPISALCTQRSISQASAILRKSNANT